MYVIENVDLNSHAQDTGIHNQVIGYVELILCDVITISVVSQKL